MAEQPVCSCGSSCGEGGPTEGIVQRLIFPCAGVANTGQLTNCAAIQLTEEGYGKAACIALLATGAEGIVRAAKDADEVLILDGCAARCAGKIADSLGICAEQSIVVTELGIEKKGSREYTDDDIETVVSAVWEGEGREE
ncbi:putative zinc-binding protein [Methanogenium organophilum]|uniref:Zinc-binding protein n=1 Tax=Methanogenium organophilum TaxID=2199 RepID=A0A9X9S1M4_METOG|nr:putative zinc-binding protein [Methanogenium organophilum]WAI00199.1 putative zinc-binding protein [Methanogenium organophilum]